MLYIRTGKPGHGKTLNTIREVDQKAAMPKAGWFTSTTSTA